MQLCNLSAAIVPLEWCSALVHPILKPNTPDPRNYRGIAVQSVVLQVLCKLQYESSQSQGVYKLAKATVEGENNKF